MRKRRAFRRGASEIKIGGTYQYRQFSSRKRSGMTRALAMVVPQVSSLILLMVASLMMAFAIHSAFAAPAGPPTNPAANVTPNFDGLNITDGGKINVKDSGGTKDVVVVDGNNESIKVKDTNGNEIFSLATTGQLLMNHPSSSPAIMLFSSGKKLAQLLGGTLNLWTTAGNQAIHLNSQDSSIRLWRFVSGINKRRVHLSGETAQLILGDDTAGGQWNLKLDGINGNITSKGKIGNFYSNDDGFFVSLNPGEKKTINSGCDQPTHQVVSCGGNYTGSNGIVYNGAWQVGSKCAAVFYNTSGSSQSGTAYVDTYCFDPSAN